jgi:erythromycin esterase
MYGLTATSPGFAAAYRGGVDIAEGLTPSDVELSLGARGITLWGSLRDPAGRPIAAAAVRALRYSDVEGDIFQVAASEDGAYAITLPDGIYMLHAESGALHAKPMPATSRRDANIDLVLRPRASGPAPQAVSDWIRRQAIPLATPEAGRDTSDLQPLKKLIGEARVVALGEATHGTRDFFQLKHRLLEFLVDEMGFSVFGIEASFPDALAVNDYVLEGRGEPDTALHGLGFWTWDTEEVLEMIRWMRRYNQEPVHRVKLKFYGFDMQNPLASANPLLEYLKRVDPEQAALALERLEPLASAASARAYSQLPAGARRETARWIAGALVLFSERKERYVALSSLGEWTLARQHANLIRQAETMLGATADRDGERDRAMAENVEWILDQEPPGAKIVLWAHNNHVAADPGWWVWDTMGSHLRRAYGSSMVAIGFSFNQGSFRALEMGKGLRTFTIGPAPEESLDAALATAGLPLLALDLRRVPRSGAVREWFATPRPMRSIGSVFSDQSPSDFLQDVDPLATYDSILFVESTTSARPLSPSAADSRRRAALAAAPAPVATNLDFETGEVGKPPEGWTVPSALAEGGYRAFVTDVGPRGGTRAARLDRQGERKKLALFGTLMQRIDAAPFRGKRVRFRAAVRAEVEAGGNQAQLWLRVDRPGGEIGFFDNMVDRPIVSPEWSTYEITGEVTEDAEALAFGLILTGKGRVWVDDGSLSVVD